jgi:hypothetical protein
MDLAIMSTAISHYNVHQQVQYSLMDRVMDQAEVNHDGLQKMLSGADVQAMQQSVQPSLGANVDVKA